MPSLRLNSRSRALSETLGANSSNTAGGSSTPSGSTGSNKPGFVRAVTTRAAAGHLPINHAYRTTHLRSDRRTPQRLHRSARAIVKRHRLPRSRSNDGKTLAAIELEEISYKPIPARSPRRHQPVTDVVATLKSRVAELEAELAQAEEGSRGHRADFKRERQRADRLVTIQDRIVGGLEALRALLEAAQQATQPVTPRTWREMSWLERWRWLRTTR